MKTITLTDKQSDKLWDVLTHSSDCGPMGERWNSELLDQLIDVVTSQLEDQGLYNDQS